MEFKKVNFRNKFKAEIFVGALSELLPAIMKCLSVNAVKLESLEDYDEHLKKVKVMFFIKEKDRYFLLNNDGSKTETSEVKNYVEIIEEKVSKSNKQDKDNSSDDQKQHQKVSKKKTRRKTSTKSKNS